MKTARIANADRIVAGGPTWRRILAASAALDGAIMLGAGIGFRDFEAIGVGVAFLAGTALLRWRRGGAGMVVLLAVSIDTLVFMIPAAVSGAAHHEQIPDFLLPASLSAVSFVVAFAGVASFVRRRATAAGAGPSRGLVRAAIVVLTLAMAAGLVQRATSSGQSARVDDVILTIQSAGFAPKTLSAPAGTVGVFASNRDLFWHTFTIDELEVNLALSTRADRRVTFSAPPGRYVFYCRIPGHKSAGMKGTLILE